MSANDKMNASRDELASEVSSASFTTAQEEQEESEASWADTLWSMWNSVSFGMFRTENNANETAVVRRDCSSMDTTPNNDLVQFQSAVNRMTDNARIPQWTKETSYTDIPICRQRETWDCGVACLQMILAWLRDDVNVDSMAYKEERQRMLDSLQTQSIWTIDLVMLLHSMCDECTNCSYLFCSKKMGVDREHNSLNYYEKAFGKDQVRVEQLFAQAIDMGINMVCLSHLGLAQVIRLVAQPNIVAIVLLDNSILRLIRQSYAGHYVIVCGTSCDKLHVRQAQRGDRRSTDSFCFVVKNPASGNEVDYISPFLLERAWRGAGTDEDIIFVAKDEGTKCFS